MPVYANSKTRTDPEKFIPVVILKALYNQKIPVYGQGLQIREWLHVSDCVRAIHTILKKGQIGEIYNIGTRFESRNIDTSKHIAHMLNKREALIRFVKDRPGHDFRYSVNYQKLTALGWKPQVTFQQGMKDTVQWYLDNRLWSEHKLTFLKNYWKKVYKP